MKKISVVFAGTGEFGAPILEVLIKDPEIEIPFVVTGLDQKAGRGMKTGFSPIKQVVLASGGATLANKLIVHQPRKIEDLKQELVQAKPDFLLVVAYGEIIGKDILDIPRFGAINIHGSLLPKYRGASPIHEAILSGDGETGVTWILMNEKMDKGDIISSSRVKISDEDTYETLAMKLQKNATDKTAKVLRDFAMAGGKSGGSALLQNESEATYCKKIAKSDGILNPGRETAEEMNRKIRAYIKWPGCWINWSGKRLKIVQARVGEQKIGSSGDGGQSGSRGGYNLEPGAVFITNGKTLAIGTMQGALFPLVVQPEGKRAMKIEEFLRGYKK